MSSIKDILQGSEQVAVGSSDNQDCKLSETKHESWTMFRKSIKFCKAGCYHNEISLLFHIR